MNSLSKIWITLLLLCSPTAFADTLSTSIGRLVVPDGLQIVASDESPDPVSGKPGGLIVFTEATKLPRAEFVFTWDYIEPDTKPFDARSAAVKIGNPDNPALAAQDATSVKVGGIEGGRYAGILPNGLSVVSYVTVNGPYRLVVLLKGPAAEPYKALTKAFSRAVEAFVWKLPAATASVSP